MKKIYLIGGAMGVGKTTVAQILKTKLSNSVFLDGDWCWDSDPFQVTEETKIKIINEAKSIGISVHDWLENICNKELLSRKEK
jgi:adenylate kinase family enzyme